MTETITTRAVVVAAGQGARFGGAVPKQFSLLRGKPLLLYSVEALASIPGMAEIAVVLPSGLTSPPPEITSIFSKASGTSGLAIRRAEGGKRRQDSVAAGLAALEGLCDVALVHDAARPFPPREPMIEAIRRARELGGAILASRATETIKRGTEARLVAETLARRELWLAQTPQCIRGDLLKNMISTLRGSTDFTDESAALESLGVPVALVESPPTNLKITGSADLLLAAALLDSQSNPRP